MYATYEDLLKAIDADELVRCTDDKNTGGVNLDRVNQALSDASCEIDGYVGVRNAVPLAPVPAIIRKCCCDIAIYNIYSRRRGADENRTARYKDSIRFLEQVARGTISLGVADPDGTPSGTVVSDFSGNVRLFDRDSLKGF
ncbi:MAG: gp436 family protein [Desulfovibrio sp.]|uniref:gp436 family protein n=1 Tax=Desulfovibrio sp. 7SRBS1 TaxID=3378064 RepID=UPI003B3CC408